MKAFQSNEVHSVFNNYPEQYQKPLLMIRELIFDVASKTKGVGLITETLKWGQPSYLTLETGSGTTIRLDRFGHSYVAIFFHCQTTLVDTFRTLFPELTYSKNRAIVLDPKTDLPIDELSMCIEMSLTYKLRKKR
ncbi:hypothetical protein TI10_02630 [Photorhabdus luminescens subsp. luminescens]|uniref:YdhG-like domain-containing protein n=1 Tax=Photorhabdus luminescens TaxID=29488 RepID=A0A1G5PQF3_PHOLU|nr:DUF1801 domain-containing protein [Photorhabdus luminescens]KMW74681.1 hypothetical protein TI10_02630 [Photorhabdus luminescens subsp. luminescens]SCZ51804.1 protein of unknown function (DU1801) [Photorhabdus luminescens]